MAYDNTCKYLAEQYPDEFASWALGEKVSRVEVLKTELSLEPIHADSITFLRLASLILHLEFQLKPPTSGKPMPERMLNYWARLYWKYSLPVIQILVWLQPSTLTAVFEDEFVTQSTRHRYQVIRIWEQSPEPLLQHEGLLPLATLAKADNAAALLGRVAQRVSNIEESRQKREIASCTEILAGLRFSEQLIRSLFREDIMKESVIYQSILREGEQKGKREGEREGRQEGERAIVIRQLTRRFGTLSDELRSRIELLSVEQLEDLGEALLDFSALADLKTYLQSLGV